MAKGIQAGWATWGKITGLMCDKSTRVKVKERVHKTKTWPAMLYGTEAIAVTKEHERKMEVAEMIRLVFSI